VYFGKEWSGFRNVECFSGKSGVDLEMWSAYGETLECILGEKNTPKFNKEYLWNH